MVSETEQLIAGLKSIFLRDLTEDEVVAVTVWQKCREMSHFISGFPNEWKMMKEMLNASLSELDAKWANLRDIPPGEAGTIEIVHAQIFAARNAIKSFTNSVDNSVELAKQVPETVKEGFRQMQAIPK